MNSSSTTLEWTSFQNLASSTASTPATVLARSTAEFLVRVATKRQYVRAIQALRRR